MTLTSFAAFMPSWDGVLWSDYGLSEEYATNYNYFRSEYLSGYAQANNLPYDFNASNISTLFNSTSLQANNGFMSLANPKNFYSAPDQTIDISSLPIIVQGRSGNSSNNTKAIVWRRVSGDGKLAIVDNYLVSNSSFTLYTIGNRLDKAETTYNNFCVSTVVDTADSNGLYKITLNNVFINGYENSSDFRLVFTDLPCYLSTTSGDSGFLGINDFTFLADNINYNYLLLDDIVNDPQAPDVPSDPWWDDAKHFLNFKVSSIYGWDTSGVDTVTHNMYFNWNSDMVMNPDYYVLNLVYRIDYKDSSMQNEKSYYYTSSDFIYKKNLEYLAYNTNSGRLINKYAMELPFSSFYDENNNSFSNDLKASITRMTGTYFPSISSIIDTSNYELDAFWGIVTKQNIASNKKLRGLKNLDVSDVPTNVEVFKITSILSVGRVVNPDPGDVPLGGNIDTDYMSGYNVSQFNFLTGNTSVLQDDNKENLYPSEDEDLPSVIEPDEVIPSGDNYSGSNNAYGGNATVNISTDPMGAWSPEVIKSIKDTFDFIQSQLSEYKDNNFLGFMIESYKIIPDPFWDMVILAGGVITGFAVIRFIRNK